MSVATAAGALFPSVEVETFSAGAEALELTCLGPPGVGLGDLGGFKSS